MKKHTKQIAAFLMVLAVVLVAGCTEKMSAEQIAARMKAQDESIRDFSAVMVTTISVDGKNTTMRAKIMTKKPDKSRDEFIEPATIAGKVIVKNGSTEWTYDPVNNQAAQRTLRENELSDPDYTRLIKGIMNETDISYKGIENVDGRRAYVIVVTPKDETDRNKLISKTRVWIDCENWMPLRIEMCGREDKRNISVKVEYNNITFNTGIPDSAFIFEVPEGVQVVSEGGAPGVAPPAPASEVLTSSVPAPPMIANWKYIGYRNLSISNAPTLNHTARITYSIVPDRDIEILSVGIHIPEGFVFVDANDARLDTYTIPNFVRHSAFWTPTNLSKDGVYQFSATIKAVKTGNWTIVAFGGSEEVYLSVYEDSAYIRDEPFPKPPSVTYFLDESELNESEIEKALANIPTDSKHDGITVYRSSHVPINATTTPSKPPEYNITRPTPCPTSYPLDVNLGDKTYAGLRYYWNGTAWVERNNQS